MSHSKNIPRNNNNNRQNNKAQGRQNHNNNKNGNNNNNGQNNRNNSNNKGGKNIHAYISPEAWGKMTNEQRQAVYKQREDSPDNWKKNGKKDDKK